MSLFNEIAPFTPLSDRLGIGLQYVGSKEIIAPKLVSAIYPHIPNAKYAFDLFGGGGAMSFAFVKSGLITTYNELKSDMCAMYSYVLDCIAKPRNEWGIFDKELYTYCTRAQWNDIRDRYRAKINLKPYEIVQLYTYSFNCGGCRSSYFKSEQKEKFANAGHIMVVAPYLKGDYKSAIGVYSDYFANELGNDIRIIENFFLEFCENPQYTKLNIYERRHLFGRFVINLEALSIAQLVYKFKGFDLKSFVDYKKRDICTMIDLHNPNLPKKEYKSKKVSGLSEPKELKQSQQLQQLQQLERLERLEQLQQLERLQRLEQLERLQQLEQLEQLQRLKRELPKLSISNNDYLAFDFTKIAKELNATPEQILIYCDIPYQCSADINANVYHYKFDINQFIEWTKKQVTNGFKIFLSELENPAPQVFTEIYSTQKARNIGKLDIITERLFLATKKD